ncbi:MAG: ABC transporter substrate-binding protein [Alphaproteobacteria bacterium]|nr:ABC transporter substrate-binding protein [Alphaproteobacteria bacterium]
MAFAWTRAFAALAVIGWALLGSQPVGAQNVAPDEAKKFITDMGNRAVATLGKQGNPGQRNAEFTALMLDGMDFDSLAVASLGKMARTASPPEKKEFTRLFAAYVIDVALEKFGNIQINRVAIGGTKTEPNGDVKVNTAIDRAGDKPLQVDWRVRSVEGKPKVNDMEVEGFSLRTHYTGEFERAGVSTVGGLIGKLKDLNKNSTAWPVVQQAMK